MKRRYKAKITWETNPNEFLFNYLSFEDLVRLDSQKFPAIHNPEITYVCSGIGNIKYRKKLIKEMKQAKKQRV